MSRHNVVATAYLTHKQWSDTEAAPALISVRAVGISGGDLRVDLTVKIPDPDDRRASAPFEAGAEKVAPPPFPSSTYLYVICHTDVPSC